VKTIPGLPERITREQMLAALAELGLDPNDTRSVRMGPEFIDVECFVRQDGKGPMVRRDVDEVATHKITYIVHDG